MRSFISTAAVGSAGKPAFSLQSLSNVQAFFGIELQQEHRRSANRSAAPNMRAFNCEVIFPSVASRIEKPCAFVRVGVERGEIRSLVRIAVWARESQVFQPCRAAVLNGPDVIDLKRKEEVCLLEMTVLALPLRPFPHYSPQGVWDVHDAARSDCRALSFRCANRWSSESMVWSSASSASFNELSRFLSNNSSRRALACGDGRKSMISSGVGRRARKSTTSWTAPWAWLARCRNKRWTDSLSRCRAASSVGASSSGMSMVSCTPPNYRPEKRRSNRDLAALGHVFNQ